MGEKIAQFSKITRLTASLQSSVKLWNRETAVVIDKKHSIDNLEKCFETVLALHVSLLFPTMYPCNPRTLGAYCI